VNAVAQISRPGIAPATLAAAGVRHVDGTNALALVGFEASGLLLPYYTRNGLPVTVDGKPFARIRLDAPTGSAKYLSPAKSGCQLYEPHGLRSLLLPGCVLGITEGEFKGLALVEAGFPCVGIGGISSACPGGELLPALVALIAEVKPSRLAFIGDGDTALIYEFSREAVKLAALSGVPVVLPRIPFDAPGKGPDDLREAWGDEFPARWQAILDAAESVTPKTKIAPLAVRLLRRERDALARLDGDSMDKARDRVVRLAAAIDEPIPYSEVEKIAADSLGLTRKTLREAAKAETERQAAEAAKRASEKALIELDRSGANPLYFDGSSYWRKEANAAFGRLCREDARLHLNALGLSKTGDPSDADAALHQLQNRNRVDYAGPLCGRPAGLHDENGMSVLATRGPVFIEGKAGDSAAVSAFLGNLLGHAAGDEHAATQCALFVGWLKLARLALRNPSEHRPGQVLALVGPPDCGKSVLQSLIITPALGGRAADPGLYFTGQTTFNADLWGAEHLTIGDKALDVDGAQRTTLRNELKRVVAESIYSLHGKCRDGMAFRPVWRVSLSANDDPESASNLPALDASFADKIIYLRCYAPPAPFYDSEAKGARESFSKLLTDELPAFLAAVDSFEIPASLRKSRFGVTEWHHPAILDLLGEGDPLRPIAEVLEKWIERWQPGEASRLLATVELYQALDDANDGTLARHKISSGPAHLGRQISKLAEKEEWRGRLTPDSRRVGGRENRRVPCWRIQHTASP
jgi:hypothetical protein